MNVCYPISCGFAADQLHVYINDEAFLVDIVVGFPHRVVYWRHLPTDAVPGFVEFHLLKGPEAEDHTLYAWHTVWKNRATFEAWTKSEAFRAVHHHKERPLMVRNRRS
jgi:hypothetical protein